MSSACFETNATTRGHTTSKGCAVRTIASVIPVSRVMSAGTGTPGFTSSEKRPRILRAARSIATTATSVMRAPSTAPRFNPVVSVSSTHTISGAVSMIGAGLANGSTTTAARSTGGLFTTLDTSANTRLPVASVPRYSRRTSVTSRHGGRRSPVSAAGQSAV